jgi:hypothetical protein
MPTVAAQAESEDEQGSEESQCDEGEDGEEYEEGEEGEEDGDEEHTGERVQEALLSFKEMGNLLDLSDEALALERSRCVTALESMPGVACPACPGSILCVAALPRPMNLRCVSVSAVLCAGVQGGLSAV